MKFPKVPVSLALAVVFLIALAFICASCAPLASVANTAATTPVPEVPVVPAPSAAVIVGLTRVNPDSYGGWNGECPGCDIDAKGIAELCASRGIPSTVLLNADATQFRFLAACAAAAKSLEPAAKAGKSPLLLIYYSGHGGQVADKNGDEADRKDETICLWDGQLTDDLMYIALCKVPAGVRVVFITDSCNSGTNYKRPKNWVRVMEARASRAEGELACQFLHMGGCGDGESSFGGDTGGVFTTALLASLSPGMSWKQWFAAASARMPRNQKPMYTEAGTFGDGEAMR